MTTYSEQGRREPKRTAAQLEEDAYRDLKRGIKPVEVVKPKGLFARLFGWLGSGPAPSIPPKPKKPYTGPPITTANFSEALGKSMTKAMSQIGSTFEDTASAFSKLGQWGVDAGASTFTMAPCMGASYRTISGRQFGKTETMRRMTAQRAGEYGNVVTYPVGDSYQPSEAQQRVGERIGKQMQEDVVLALLKDTDRRLNPLMGVPIYTESNAQSIPTSDEILESIKAVPTFKVRHQYGGVIQSPVSFITDRIVP